MITYLKFKIPVSIGATEIEYWSGFSSDTSALFKSIKVIDRGDKGVLLEYRSGKASADVEVRWSNLAQVSRAAPEPAKEQKK